MYTPSPTQSIQARQFQQQMQNFPSAQQTAQNGLPPQLLQMITEAIAAETVQKATQAAQGQVAQAMGGPQPTVADSVKAKLQQAGLEAAQQKLAMGSNGHAEMQQKAQGLAAIANQGQNVPQAQGAPQGPVQASKGGLMRLPSNLPSSYAGGGIVAFEDGGGVGDTVMGWMEKLGLVGAKKELSDSLSPQERQAQALAEVNKANAMDPNTPHRSAFDDRKIGGEQPPEPIPGESTSDWDSRVSQYYQRQIKQGAALALTTERNAPNIEEAQRRITNVTNAPPPPGPGASPRANAPTGGSAPSLSSAPVTAQPNLLGAAPTATPDETAFSKWTQDLAKELGGIKPDTVEKAARDDITSRMQAAFGPEQAALRAARQQDYDTAKAAHEARMAKSAPGWADRYSALRAAFGHWGEGGQAIREMELAHEATKAGGLEKLMAQKQAMDAMSLADKKEMFGTAENKGAAERKAAQGQQLAGLTSATALRDADVRALGMKQAAWDAAQVRLQAAQLHYSQLAANGTQMDRAEKQAATARMVALMQQTQTELTSLTKEGMVISPEDAQRRAALQQQLDALKKQVAATIPGMDALPEFKPSTGTTTKEEYDKLPKGARYTAPDGSIRNKQ